MTAEQELERALKRILKAGHKLTDKVLTDAIDRLPELQGDVFFERYVNRTKTQAAIAKKLKVTQPAVSVALERGYVNLLAILRAMFPDVKFDDPKPERPSVKPL